MKLDPVRALPLAIALLLTACGGGGGGDSASSPAAGGSPAPVTAAPASLSNPFMTFAAVAEPTALTGQPQDTVEWVSHFRRSVGLPALAYNAQLAAAAAAHSGYIAAGYPVNEGHDETAGRTGYTGAAPAVRALAAGYPANRGVGEEINYGVEGRDAVEGLVDAPFHRLGLLWSFDEAGAGVVPVPALAASVFTIDLGSSGASAGVAASQVIAYPRPGQSDVPTAWIVRESPSPAPDLDNMPIGYPITVQAKSGSRLVLSTLILQGPSGETVTGRLAPKPRGDEAAAMFLPLAPLASASRYTVAAAGTLDGLPLTLSWSFTTQTVAPLTLSASAGAVTPSSPVTVTLTGGAGRQREFRIGLQYSIAAGSTAPPGLSFAVLKKISKTTLTLTRNGTACVPPLGSCAVVFQAYDSSGGAPVELVIPAR